MNTANPAINKPMNNTLSSQFGTWLMILATLALGLIITVEVINILFYDPYEEEYFLFRFAGVLADVDIGPLTYLMFGSKRFLISS